MNESQRAVIAAKLANMQRGAVKGNQYAAKNKSANLPISFTADNISQEDAVNKRWNTNANLQLYKVETKTAANLLNVSPRLVAAVKAVERAAPELVKEIERGEKTVHEAEADLHCRVLTIPGLLTSRK